MFGRHPSGHPITPPAGTSRLPPSLSLLSECGVHRFHLLARLNAVSGIIPWPGRDLPLFLLQNSLRYRRADEFQVGVKD